MSSAGVTRKQRTTQEDWTRALDRIEELVPRARLDALVDATLVAMRRTLARFSRVAFAWSGGKDSQVLERLCRRVGVTEGVLGICELEYPAFLRWVAGARPTGLEVVNTGQDLAWLARNQRMLFPQDAATAGKWFRIVQHTAQERYYRARRLDCLLLGRRKADGNYTGPGDCYTNSRGVTRYSPLAAWSHEAVLAFLAYERIDPAPFYRWPNGYRCGTHPWAARQWTGSTAQGWREVYTIDPGVVERAASAIPSAADFLRSVA